QVLVEAREEPEAVLSGKVLAASGPGVRHGDAAVLAAPRLAFVDGDLEPALGELLGGGEPAHPAAEHGDAAPGGEPARRGGPVEGGGGGRGVRGAARERPGRGDRSGGRDRSGHELAAVDAGSVLVARRLVGPRPGLGWIPVLHGALLMGD